MGLSGLTWLRRPEEPRAAWVYAGVHAPYWGAAVLRDALDDPQEVARRVGTLPPEVRGEVRRGMGTLLALQDLSWRAPEAFAADARALVAAWPEAWRRDLLRGVGTSLRGQVPYGGPAPEAVRVFVGVGRTSSSWRNGSL